MLSNGNTCFFRKYRGKRFRKRDSRRVLAALLCVCMLIPSCIDAMQARALEGAGLCEHHTVHDETCGYQEAQEGEPCTHEHDENCGYMPGQEGTACDLDCPVVHAEGCAYTSAVEEIPCDMGCTDTDGDGVTDHMEGCAFTPAAEEIPCDMDCQADHMEGCAFTPAAEEIPCGHIHDEDCGYQEAREAQPCTFECVICTAAEKPDEIADVVSIAEWEWIDEQGMLTWDEAAQTWTLALIGVGAEKPVTREMLADFLPNAVNAKPEGNDEEEPKTPLEEDIEPAVSEIPAEESGTEAEERTETLEITWDLSAFPEAEVCEGSYPLYAVLPEGYALAADASAMAVTVQLGGAKMYVLPPLLTADELEGHTVTGIDPAGTTVNLFDYWVLGEELLPGDPGGDLLTKESDPNGNILYHGTEDGKNNTKFSGPKNWNFGINHNHLLIFGDGVIHAGLWNKGAGENTRYGKEYAGMEEIVKPVLDKDGYPVINTANARKKLIDDQKKRDWELIKDWKLSSDTISEWNSWDYKDYSDTGVKNLSETVIKNWQDATKQTIETGTESLIYLFSPFNQHTSDEQYRRIYADAKGLFQMDNEGYYYYNMRKNFAEYNKDTGRFTLYDAPATIRTDGEDSIGNFFPFNKGTQVFSRIVDGELKSEVPCSGRPATAENPYLPYGYYMNHHLGMTITTDFRQPADGMVKTGAGGSQPMSFQFAGDDDVWVFIDDVLVLDLGGTHSELYGTIDFATGEICIGRGFGAPSGQEDGIPIDPANDPRLVTKTTLKEMFKKAGRVNQVRWNKNTFASESDHTLKMFYLERGNYDSSLAIRFNLQPRLEQEVKKVDQHGNPVQGVEFALYPAAEGNGEGAILCTNAKDATPSRPKYIVQTGDTVLATLKTDKDGIGNFIDSSIVNRDGSGVPFNFADFYDPDGTQGHYYILKEMNAPQGYRMLPIPIVLEFDKETNLLTVANRWTTGAHASFVSHISGNQNITYGHYNSGSGNVEMDWNKTVSEEAQRDGLAVAIPMQKQEDDAWEPIYGNNLEGQTTVNCPANDVDKWRIAALKAVLYQSALLAEAQEKGDRTVTADWHLIWNQEEDHLEGTLTDLPGDALRYRMNNPAHPEKADMRMEYALITPKALVEVIGEVDAKNTDHHKKYIALGNVVRNQGGTRDQAVDAIAERIMAVSEPSTGSEKGFSFLNVDQFNRSFRSQIYIPNEQRELRVLKIDQNGKAVNDVVFGLYTDQACTNMVARGTTHTVDGQDGTLIFAPYADKGTGYAKMEWATANNTQYYLREISSPAGYIKNDTIIPVIVGTYSIYADAGTPDDGVTVMAGVGKLTQTMHKYASNNAIDVTLRDITAVAQEQSSGTFTLDGWEDIKLEGTALERDMNLHYGKNTVIDYGLHDEDGGKNYGPYFVTDSGFIRARVKQNAAALSGGEYGESTTTNWDNLGETDITSLFSLLNTVVVTNQTTPDTESGQLQISKTVQGNGLSEADYKKNFMFRITLTDAGSTPLAGEYYFYGTDKSGFVRSGDTLPLHHDESITIQGLPVGAKYQVQEENESGWHVIKPDTGFAAGTIENNVTAEANFINSKQKMPRGSLTVKKTVTGEQGDKNKLFTFDITLGDKTLNGTFGEITFKDGKASITLKDGEQKTAENLPAGITYTVTEKEANQDGYQTSSQNTNGTIPEGGGQAAAFTNSRQETSKGSLTVKKIVTGELGDKNKLFTFDITLGDKTLNGTFGEITFKDGKASITLKDGEQKTAENLPAGITYTVTEKEANQDGYKTSSQNTNGTIPEGGGQTAAFTNSRQGEETPSGGGGGGGGGSEKPPAPPKDPEPPKEPEEPVIPEVPEEPEIEEIPEIPEITETPEVPQESNISDHPEDWNIYDNGVPRDGRDREKSGLPGLPQTGTVWRNVLLVAAAGMVLLITGAAQNRKNKNGKR